MLARWFPPRKPPSAHFSWAEVIRNSGYDRVPLGPMLVSGFGIVFPRRYAIKQAERMESLRIAVNQRRHSHGLTDTGIRVRNWARSVAHNKAVGGVRGSQHLAFRACDIDLAEIERLFSWQNGRAEFDSVIELIFFNGGVGYYPAGNRHVDTRGSRARWTSA